MPHRPVQHLTALQALKQLPPDLDLLRHCLAGVHAEFGRSLGRVEFHEDLEDADLGLAWQKRSRRVCLGITREGLVAAQWKDQPDGTGYGGPEVAIQEPEDLLRLLRWLNQAPPAGEWDG